MSEGSEAARRTPGAWLGLSKLGSVVLFRLSTLKGHRHALSQGKEVLQTVHGTIGDTESSQIMEEEKLLVGLQDLLL
ncbi:hypothetical protein Q7C36_008904 [Tachysurus vachellii]|uniref:Uncharacterized protein n=1 Tax=Tachysurus vachellii TaxID=175792 RepID=A0AA88N6T0_TACVA|nr:hypothetical protein Q7C36_008904 [Tachysurus vachellii]